jgi:hypothetical protein
MNTTFLIQGKATNIIYRIQAPDKSTALAAIDCAERGYQQDEIEQEICCGKVQFTGAWRGKTLGLREHRVI